MSQGHRIPCGFRLTHIPTGISVTWPMRINHPKPAEMRAEMEAAKRCLRGKIAIASQPKAEPAPVRSYHLDPPLGIEPFIKQDGRPRITGRDQVEAVLQGEFLPSEL